MKLFRALLSLAFATVSLCFVRNAPFKIGSGSVPHRIGFAQVKMAQTAQTITIPQNYNVAAGFFATGASISFFLHALPAGIPITLIGILLFVQTGRVRFMFDQEALEVKVQKPEGELGDSGENFAVGGKNRWKYNTFTDWFFIPSKEFPILMYFNENQTSEKGQLHLFPVIMDGKVLNDVMTERVGPSSR